jgi:TonB-dependent SusC/RagA subfamily outer membrane receptor
MKSRIIILILLFVATSTLLRAQESTKKITLKGVVTDINQKPVAGARILVDNINTTRVTNNKGFYKVKVKAGSEVISVISISGAMASSLIVGKTEINFSLPIDAMSESNKIKDSAGDEEVNIGYGTVKKKNLLTPVGQVDGTNKKYASYQNIYEMLRGQPGVQVNGTSVKIQGASSFTSGTEPLYVIDGIIVNTLDGIQPQMVKSIEVLKGPSASIYGSRGANGVILITLTGAADFK